jgi:hypothetical protein
MAGFEDNRPRRVAVYGRVSTEHEAQVSAFENQLEWYQEEMKRHPEWTLAGVYADKGITGTSAQKRPRFMKMIEDANGDEEKIAEIKRNEQTSLVKSARFCSFRILRASNNLRFKVLLFCIFTFISHNNQVEKLF